MIEFRADCGHVIQALDQDAGKIVKCAYCGREVEAPLRDEEDPDLLFQEVDLNELAKSESLAGARVAMTIEGRQKKARIAPSAKDVAQTGNRILRISLVSAFSAICLIVLVLGIRSMVNSMTSPEPPSNERFGAPIARVTEPQTPSQERRSKPADTTGTHPRATKPTATTPPIAQAPGGRVGHSFSSISQGVFVEVFNEAARIYVREQESSNQEVLGADESEREGSGTLQIPLPPGQYRIGVVLPAADDALVSLSGFDAIRSDLESEDEDTALAEFFFRDASSETAFIDDSGFRQSVVRYYDVAVQPQEWTLVSSLFMPSGSIRTLMSNLPNEDLYSFDTTAVRRELIAYGISRGELSSVIDVLARAGQVIRPASDRGDGEFYIFEIDVRDGTFRTRQLEIPEHAEEQAVASSDTGSLPQQSSRSVWGRRSTSTPAAGQNEPKPSLQTVLGQLREKLAENGTLNAVDLRPYLAGGKRHQLWKNAEVDTRVSLAGLLEKDIAASLVEELGATMLNDPDLSVRLALLASLVLSADKEAIEPIDQRLEAIEDDDTLDEEEADLEEKELRQALATLSGPRAKGLWGR